MIIKLLVLLLVAVAWVAALWLGIGAGISTWSNPGLIASHAVPPLLVWAIWLGWRRRVETRKAADAQEKEARAQAERAAAREAAQKRHADELRLRRFACDCRALVISGLVSPVISPLDIDVPYVDIAYRMSDEARDQTSAILDRMTPAATDALSKVYAASPASMVFPIYVSPPAEVSGEEVLARVRAIHAGLAGMLSPEFKAPAGLPKVLFLPTGDCAANSVISLFEGEPDLPGAIVLAFDSPYSRQPIGGEFDEEPAPAQVQKEQRNGKPGEAAVALLLTNMALASMLDAIADIDTRAGEHDSMTPFWEKAAQPGGQLAALASVSADLRQELAQLPLLGRIHRADLRPATQGRTGVLEMTRLVQAALERAQVNAGLIEPPFSYDDAPATATEVAQEAGKPRCAMIVHNAGGVDFAGKRLAALGASLYYFGIDLSPVDPDTALNVVSSLGDLGRASGTGHLALGIANAARQAGPVLCAEYSAEDDIAVSFIMQAPPDA